MSDLNAVSERKSFDEKKTFVSFFRKMMKLRTKLHESSIKPFASVQASKEEPKKADVLPSVPGNYGPRTISLELLIDWAVQRTYHNLYVLVEMLQKKTERNRKLSLVHFVHSTRSTFLKLCALVKWVKRLKELEKLTSICYALDQISAQFVDTADQLAFLGMEMVGAR
jgi:hypothetical protein